MHVSVETYFPVPAKSNLDHRIVFQILDRFSSLAESYIIIRGHIDVKNNSSAKVTNFGCFTLFSEAQLLINDRPVEIVNHFPVTVTYSCLFRLSPCNEFVLNLFGSQTPRDYTVSNALAFDTAKNGSRAFEVILPLKDIFSVFHKNIRAFSCKKAEIILKRSQNDDNLLHDISTYKVRYAKIEQINLISSVFGSPVKHAPHFVWDKFECWRLSLATDQEQRIQINTVTAAQRPKYLFLLFLGSLDASRKEFYEPSLLEFDEFQILCNDQVVDSIDHDTLNSSTKLGNTTYLKHVDFLKNFYSLAPNDEIEPILNSKYFQTRSILIFNLMDMEIPDKGLLNFSLYFKSRSAVETSTRLYGIFVSEAEFK